MKKPGFDELVKAPKREKKAPVFVRQNKGVEDRAYRDLQQLETDETKEAKRIAALERKAQLYESLQRKVNVDDEAANDQFEVDFIAKALTTSPDAASQRPQSSSQRLPAEPSMHPEAILERQREIRRQMQGGGSSSAEYSTYAQDVAELEAQHRRVDELNEMNAKRIEEFEAERKKRVEREVKKRKESSKHKDMVLQRLLQSRKKSRTKETE